MDDFWGVHWWLIIILAAMWFPIAGMLMGAWSQHLYFRHRREALETLKIYAAQGREPPPEVLEALSGRAGGAGRWRARRRGAAGPTADLGATAGDWQDAVSAQFSARAARRMAREPFRRWHNAIFMSALTAGLYLASKQIHDAVIADRFLVAAIIVGALAAAALVSAVLVTVFRPR